jgi:glyoxylase-like metal-dependent hydrolase (beta-lactamase superfamily II)
LYSIPISNRSNPNPKYFSLNDTFQYGDINFKILFVPGHSPGHVAFYNKENNFVINGDCLFENSIGRTDLPGGDHGSLIKSIKEKLFQLPENTVVYCGHGNETTIEKEKSENPFLR